MKTNEKSLKEKENIVIDASISNLIQYELKRYKSKGYGLILAWIGAISYIHFFPNLLKHYWPENIKNPGLFYGLSIYIFFNLTLLLTNLEYFFYYSLEHPFLERYKTTPDPWPWKQNKEKWNTQLKKAIKTVCFNSLILLPLFLLPNIITDECPHRYDRESLPGLYEIISQIAICMIIEDFFFYLSHRLLHTDYFYSKIHKIHHEFKESVSISAIYAHPIEYIMGNILPSSIAPLLLGNKMHMMTYLVYIVMVLHESHDGHSGYSFSWCPHRVIPMTFDADFHIFHHWKFRGNYANYFSLWDKFFGTVNKTFLDYFNNKEAYVRKYLEINSNSNDTKED
jgi:sterol desaturase/sphingolipid hydroxylase (fatty acid hydroxylase superfamily)